jgi:heptosyltransferase I
MGEWGVGVLGRADLMSPSPHPPSPPIPVPSRILIVKMSSLGDLFHALPAVHYLKEGLKAEVDWVVNDLYADLVRCFTDVARVIPFPRKGLAANFLPFRAELRKESYDYVFDLQGLMKSALVGQLARGRRRIGPSFQREGAWLFYDAVAGPKNKDRHAVEECLDTVRFLGLAPGAPVFPMEIPPLKVEPHYPRVALLPCSRRRDKNWPAERFIEVGRALVKERGAAIYLVGSSDDAGACERIGSQLSGRVYNLAGKTSLVELCGLLKGMDLMVTVDSGPMHMAAALGVPVVAVFGPTFPGRTGPYGEKHRVIKQGNDLAQLPAAPVIAAAIERLT